MSVVVDTVLLLAGVAAAVVLSAKIWHTHVLVEEIHKILKDKK